jgi:hypothetical protein
MEAGNLLLHAAEFTMLNQGKVILCAVSTAAMDDLEGGVT